MEKCIQQQTGSCAGCDVAEMVRAKSREAGQRQPVESVARRIQTSLCPEGTELQTRVLRAPTQSVW